MSKPEYSLGEAKIQLAQAAEKCLGLAELLQTTGSADAAILRDGAKAFSHSANNLAVAENLLRIIADSFPENGPRLPTLLRAIENLDLTKGDFAPDITDTPALTQPMIGIFKCDRGGQFIAHFNEHLPEWLLRNCHRPKKSNFNQHQQAITEAFFMHEGRDLILPSLVDVYGYYLQNKFKRHGINHFFESDLPDYQWGFFNQAGQVIHKIRNLGIYNARKFNNRMSEIRTEYEDIVDYPITPETLEKIALREIPL